ncbi:hypothetical protein Tco_1406429 [Tanacetum coccineum]
MVDYVIHDENLGSTIAEYEEKLMDELAVDETLVNDFIHDESSSLPDIASDVNKVVCRCSSPIIKSDEMPTHIDVDNLRIHLNEAAIN